MVSMHPVWNKDTSTWESKTENPTTARVAIAPVSGARDMRLHAPGMGGAQPAPMREASYSTVTAQLWIQSRSLIRPRPEYSSRLDVGNRS